MEINQTVFYTLHSLAHQSVFLDWLIVFSANLFGMIMIGIAIFFLSFHTDGVFDYKKPFLQMKNKIREIFSIFISGVFAWVVATVIKYIVVSPRPFLFFEDVKPLFLHGGMESFPSGHATFFSAIAVALYLKHKNIGILYILVAIIISLARVIAGVHFPVDILAGWILGAIIAIVFHKIFKK
jgi:membrane-associated phospholipid phosphatase